MYDIEFVYANEQSEWVWKKQECRVSSIEECKIRYGLTDDGEKVQWMITSVKECKE